MKNVYSLRGVSHYSDGEQRDNTSQENNDDIQLIQNMRQMGLDLLQQYQPEALAAEDYILCFHIPPFNSVDHLHLHVLAPASEMNWVYREIKYKYGARDHRMIIELVLLSHLSFTADALQNESLADSACRISSQ